MKKHLNIGFILLSFLGFLVACSNGEMSRSSDMASNEMAVVEESLDLSLENDGDIGENKIHHENGTSNGETAEIRNDNRKIIYNAHLNIEVKNLDKSISDMRQRTESLGGYVVESMVQERKEGIERTGHVTLRVPQEKLQEFIDFVEDGSSKVKENSISGQDVTEEYVDLESRLKTKQMVEERLLNFMEQADKTEDLLAISNDLATVQEEIEGIKGRMQYLDNQTDLATVTIFLEENNVTLAGGEDSLNTWDKTKEQMVKSIQFLVTAFSNLIIFFIGNLPIIMVLTIIGISIFYMIRKRRKSR